MSAARAEKLCYLLVPGQDQTLPVFLKLREKVGRQLSCREKLLSAVGSYREQGNTEGMTGARTAKASAALLLPTLPTQPGHGSACAGPGAWEEQPPATQPSMAPGLGGDSLLSLEKRFALFA